MQLSRLQRIYHLRKVSYDELVGVFGEINQPMKSGKSYFFSGNCVNGEKPYLVSMDSDLEAFSRNPTRGSVGVLPFQAAPFTKYAA